MVTTLKIINYENGKSNHCKNIQSLRIDNEEITNQNTIATIFNSYFSSIAETLKSGNNKHINIKETNPINCLINSFHRPFPKMRWQYASTHEVEKCKVVVVVDQNQNDSTSSTTDALIPSFHRDQRALEAFPPDVSREPADFTPNTMMSLRERR